MVETVDELTTTTSSSSSSSSEDSDTDNNTHSSNNSRCPFCNASYNKTGQWCVHLICEFEYVESLDGAIVEVLDHPVIASVLGVHVPRVVASRFMLHLRSKSENATTDAHGIHTLDLLNKSHGVTMIKHSREDDECFREWTCYLTERPHEVMREFVGFVKKHYCAQSNPASVPFARVQATSAGVMTLHVDDLIREKCQAGTWVMLTDLPDDLPLFFYATPNPHYQQQQQQQGHTPAIIFLNHSSNLLDRQQHWQTVPSYVILHTLVRLPAVALS